VSGSVRLSTFTLRAVILVPDIAVVTVQVTGGLRAFRLVDHVSQHQSGFSARTHGAAEVVKLEAMRAVHGTHDGATHAVHVMLAFTYRAPGQVLDEAIRTLHEADVIRAALLTQDTRHLWCTMTGTDHAASFILIVAVLTRALRLTVYRRTQRSSALTDAAAIT